MLDRGELTIQPAGRRVVDLRDQSILWHAEFMRRDQELNAINVEGIPQRVARGLEVVVAMLRQELRTGPDKNRITWPIKHGDVIGSLRRRDIYEDVG